MPHVRLRLMRDADIPVITALNDAATPAVNVLSADQMRELVHMCDVALVATDAPGSILAFALSLCPGQHYESENYRWFEDRGVSHQYVDRIVVSSSARGTGVGRALYESIFERARERGVTEVTAEINVDPPNPVSMSFHERLGFRRLAEQDTKGGAVRVALMARPVQ